MRKNEWSGMDQSLLRQLAIEAEQVPVKDSALRTSVNEEENEEPRAVRIKVEDGQLRRVRL